MSNWTDEDVEIGLRAARANGRREGLEEAAKACETIAGAWHNADPSGDIQRCAEAIRALIDQPPVPLTLPGIAPSEQLRRMKP